MKYLLSLFASVLFLSAASADMAPLVSNKKVVGNGKYLLVMLYPEANAMNKNNPLDKMYPKSGLYLNDGSRDPIWTVDGPFEGQVFLSADGDFLAHLVFPADSDGDGVRFLHKGKVVRSHRVKELTRPDTIQEACPSCIWHNEVKFNDANETVVLEARDGRTWTFNLRTGDGVAESPPMNFWWIAIGIAIVAAGFFLLLVAVALGALIWRARSASEKPASPPSLTAIKASSKSS